MKKRNVFLVILLLGSVSFFACTQTSKNNTQGEKQYLVKKNNMQKDAQEYLTAFKKASKENAFVALFGLDADMRIKKKSILQKYQGDELVEFSETLKDEYKDRTGEDIPDLLLIMLLEEDE